MSEAEVASEHLTSLGQAHTVEVGRSFLPDLKMALRSMIATFENPRMENESGDNLHCLVAKNVEFDWINLISVLKEQASGPPMKMSLLAKRLLAEKHTNLGLNAVLATPLHVTMAA